MAGGGGYVDRRSGEWSRGFLWRRSSFFVGRGAEVEDGESGLTDQAGEEVDAGAGTVGAAENEEGLRADVDCGEDGAPVLFEVASAAGEGVAVEDQRKPEGEPAAVVGRAGGYEDRLPAVVGKGAELAFGEEPAEVGTGAADGAEGLARLYDGCAPADVVGERLAHDVDG